MSQITKQDIRAALDLLASEAWLRRDEPGELERAAEIRKLAQEQALEDVYNVSGHARDRVGPGVAGRVLHFDPAMYPATLRFPSREEQALRAGLEPFLERLTWEERDMLRWIYDSRWSFREVAAKLGVYPNAVTYRLNKVRQKLRQMLLEAFAEEVPGGDSVS